MNKQEKQALVDSVPIWFHTIDFGDKVVSPGVVSLAVENHYVRNLPALQGKTVLDIGAWDGFLSFKAEELGASRVVASDEFVWVRDFSKTAPHEVLDYENLPGKRGFDVAHKIKNSKVETHIGSVESLSVQKIGTFDVVIFSGVLYHLKSPYTAIETLYELTNEVVHVETQAIHIAGFEDRALLEFYDDDLNHDETNWFAPNFYAVKKMFKTVGFKKIVLKAPGVIPGGTGEYRLIFHAYK